MVQISSVGDDLSLTLKCFTAAILFDKISVCLFVVYLLFICCLFVVYCLSDHVLCFSSRLPTFLHRWDGWDYQRLQRRTQPRQGK